MRRRKYAIYMDKQIKKVNVGLAANDVSLHSPDISETVRYELLVSKCLPVLLHGIGFVKTNSGTV